MTTTNTYTDTKAVDYLQTIKKNQLEARNLKSSSSNFDMTYMIARDSEIAISNTATATAQTLADYDIVNNTGKCIVYLPFDLDTLDASNSNDGTVTGTETYVDGPEISSTHRMRKAFSFNGSSYVTLANETNFDLERTSAMSFSFWIKWNNSSLTNIFIKAKTTANYEGIWIYGYTDGKIYFDLFGTDGTFYSIKTDTTLNDNLWHHITITKSTSYSGSASKIYVDGTLQNVTVVSQNLAATILNNFSPVIGADSGGGNPCTCYIDDFQVWNVELTQADVTRLSGGRQISKDTTATNPAYLGFSDVT